MRGALLVFLGGGLGSLARWATTILAVRLVGPAFPVGTLAVNLAGCFLIGFVHELATLTARVPPDMRLFLTTGVMGGLTTYSSFNYEALVMFERGSGLGGILYVVAMVGGCGVAGLLGLLAARAVVLANA